MILWKRGTIIQAISWRGEWPPQKYILALGQLYVWRALHWLGLQSNLGSKWREELSSCLRTKSCRTLACPFFSMWGAQLSQWHLCMHLALHCSLQSLSCPFHMAFNLHTTYDQVTCAKSALKKPAPLPYILYKDPYTESPCVIFATRKICRPWAQGLQISFCG